MGLQATPEKSLAQIFRYIAENKPVLDNALLPPFTVLEELQSLLAQKGLDAFQPEDSMTLIEMIKGLRVLSAEKVDGYYDQTQFDAAHSYAVHLGRKGLNHDS